MHHRTSCSACRLLTDANSTVWFDPAMKALQQRIDKLLPGTINLVTMGPRAATAVGAGAVVFRHPAAPSWNLFNTETGELNKVGDAYPAIDPARMGKQEPVRYKARDGLTIPALLTLPHGSARKNLPLVVLVHGGPYVRGADWGCDPQAQFLASRGYAVLEPEYRGSTGFGSRHYHAGWKQWGLKMQDDIADGAKWAIAQGIVDPQRICIAGASYGGYATLMGLINDPELFKCGVDWVGVTDIGLLYTGHWHFTSDTSDDSEAVWHAGTGGRPRQGCGAAESHLAAGTGGPHPAAAAAGLRRRRPARAALPWQQILRGGQGHQPGRRDGGVRRGRPRLGLPKNRIDFWSRVEKFLDKNIGAAARK